MQTITLDSQFSAKLMTPNQPVELRDETGRVLGHFMPLDRPLGEGVCPHTDEEIEQLRSQPGGRPLAEIWKSLEQGS